jgi:hypothetical protein
VRLRVLEEIARHKRYHDEYSDLEYGYNGVVAADLGAGVSTVSAWRRMERNHTGKWVWEKIAELSEYLDQVKAKGETVESMPVLRKRFGLSVSQVSAVSSLKGIAIYNPSLDGGRISLVTAKARRRKELAEKIRNIEGYERKSANELRKLLSISDVLVRRVMKEEGIVTGLKCTEIDCQNIVPFTRLKAGEYKTGRCSCCNVGVGAVTEREKYIKRKQKRLEKEAETVLEFRALIDQTKENKHPDVVGEAEIPEPEYQISSSDMYVITNEVKFRIDALRQLSIKIAGIADVLEKQTLQTLQVPQTLQTSESETQKTRAQLMKMLARNRVEEMVEVQ